MASLATQTERLVLLRERERYVSGLEKMRAELRRKAPVDTGATRDAVGTQGIGGSSTRLAASGTVYRAWVFSKTKQALFTDTGTGLFGPSGRYITPKVAKVLRWIDKNSGQAVFRPRSRGSGKHKGWFTKTVATWPQILQGS